MLIQATATGFQDFLDKLKAGLTANNWTNLRDVTASSSRELYFKNNATDTVIGFKEISGTGYSNLILNSCLSYSGSLDFYNQPGSVPNNPFNTVLISSKMPVLGLNDVAMNYWLFIDDDRVVIVVNISSVYNAAYLGRCYQIGTPEQYPHPLFVGGNCRNQTQQTSDINSDNTNFMNERSGNYGSKIRTPDGQWLEVPRASYNGSDTTTTGRIFPPKEPNQLKTSGGTYETFDFTVFSITSTLAKLKDVIWIAANDLTTGSEITTEDGTYVIFNDVFRTTAADYFAVKK